MDTALPHSLSSKQDNHPVNARKTFEDDACKEFEETRKRGNDLLKASFRKHVQTDFNGFLEDASLADLFILRELFQTWDGFTSRNDEAVLPGAMLEFLEKSKPEDSGGADTDTESESDEGTPGISANERPATVEETDETILKWHIVKNAATQGLKLAARTLIEDTQREFEDFLLCASAEDIYILNQALANGTTSTSFVDAFFMCVGQRITDEEVRLAKED